MHNRKSPTRTKAIGIKKRFTIKRIIKKSTSYTEKFEKLNDNNDGNNIEEDVWEEICKENEEILNTDDENCKEDGENIIRKCFGNSGVSVFSTDGEMEEFAHHMKPRIKFKTKMNPRLLSVNNFQVSSIGSHFVSFYNNFLLKLQKSPTAFVFNIVKMLVSMLLISIMFEFSKIVYEIREILVVEIILIILIKIIDLIRSTSQCDKIVIKNYIKYYYLLYLSYLASKPRLNTKILTKFSIIKNYLTNIVSNTSFSLIVNNLRGVFKIYNVFSINLLLKSTSVQKIMSFVNNMLLSAHSWSYQGGFASVLVSTLTSLWGAFSGWLLGGLLACLYSGLSLIKRTMLDIQRKYFFLREISCVRIWRGLFAWPFDGLCVAKTVQNLAHLATKCQRNILNTFKIITNLESCDENKKSLFIFLNLFLPSIFNSVEKIKTIFKNTTKSQFSNKNYLCRLSKNSSVSYRQCYVAFLLLASICCCSVSASPEALALRQQEEDEVLHIGGIFPINGEGGWQGGQACMPAANLALEDVNKRKDLLPGFQLRLHSNDSECEPGLGASVMYNLLYNPPQKLLLLAGCSTVCTTVAEAAKMWNLMVLCYGASSPALSDRRRFPTLFRTHPSATVHNPTRIRLMKKFGWSRVAILQQAEEVFISTVEDLEARCKEAGIEIVTRQSFLSDPGDAVRNLRRQDARIIVGLFYVVAARRVLCDLYKQNLYGKSYVWFFIGWYEDNWFEVNLEKEGVECTAEQMRAAAEGHLTTEALMWNQNQQPTISGMTAEDFRLRLNAVLQDEGYDIDKMRYPEGYQEAPLAYDAVWAVALAFNKTMERLSRSGRSLKNFTYTDKEIADDIYAAINSTSFLGVSGIVAFSSQGDRIALTQIEQMIGGEYVKLGYYDTQADNLTWYNREKWAGGKVPQDRTIIRRELRLVSLPLYACISAVALAGICVAIGLIVFNVWNNHRRVIQSSHPVCNTIMLVGCALCLAGILVLGADGRVVSPEGFPALCQARLWLLSLGFTLAYGAMFSKVWRVHRFTTKAKVDPKKKVEPWKLYTMVSGLLLIDTVILLSWQLKDPLLRKIEQFPLEEPPSALDDSKIRPELEHCESEHNTIWLGVIYGYKGLVLVFGLFLAYETRSVKLRQINDSRYVGMSIYNVVVLCLITAPVSLVVASQQDANFAFVSLAVIFCCFLSMALIFVPKVIEVIRHPKDRAESKYNPDAGQSREDEEKYHKLLAENDQLQQLIAAKEEKIRSLKQKIAEKEGQQGKTTLLGVGGGLVGAGNLQTAIIKDTTITQDVEEEHI